MAAKSFKVDLTPFGAITNGGKRWERLDPKIEQDLFQTLLHLMVELQSSSISLIRVMVLFNYGQPPCQLRK